VHKLKIYFYTEILAKAKKVCALGIPDLFAGNPEKDRGIEKQFNLFSN
jgi:hypothetical protein